jgi:RNA-binding protein
MMTPAEARELKDKARLLEPIVRIGKNGLTDPVVEHICKMLVKRHLVKVKFLRSFLEDNDRKEAASKLAKATESDLLDQVGFVVVLYKR